PPPADKQTRLAQPFHPVPPTREASIPMPPPPPPTFSMGGVPPGLTGTAAQPPVDAPRPVGRATVERILGERLGEVTTQMKGESRKTLWVALAGVAALLIA